MILVGISLFLVHLAEHFSFQVQISADNEFEPDVVTITLENQAKFNVSKLKTYMK